MSQDWIACIMKAADRFFGSVSSAGSALLLDGLENELEAAAKTQRQLPARRGVCAEIENVMRAAKHVKNTGVYPFYITRLAAAALHGESQEEQALSHAIALAGVKKAAGSLYGMADEPELLYMIEAAFEQLLAGRLADIDAGRLALIRIGYENGFYNEKTYHGCAQCTIKAFSDALGIADEKQAYLFRAASSLAGGIGICTDSACGAYSGSSMIIGTLAGRTLEHLGEAENSSGPAHALSQQMHDRFVSAYGSVNCRDLHVCKFGRTYDLRDPQQAAQMHEDGAHDVICPTTVGLATAWLIEVLLEEGLIRP